MPRSLHSGRLVIYCVYLLLLLAAALPFATLLAQVFASDSSGVWMHYASTVLPGYVWNSTLLGLSVALLAGSIGVCCAWQIEHYDFPGRRLLAWLLLLPLAMPSYVAAYAITDVLQFSGPIQTTLRQLTGWSKGDYWFPELFSIPGAIVVFSLTLYPYVYLIARTAFAERGNELFEAARTLGLNHRQAWWRAALPAARPAIAGGTLLVLMETLADYGTVFYFGVDTLTTGIYRAWQNMGELVAAAQLASALLAVVIAIVSVERWSRRRARYNNTRQRSQRQLQRLNGWRGWTRTLLCLTPLILGFIGPVILLTRLLYREWGELYLGPLLSWTRNSLTVGFAAALCVVLLALLLHSRARLYREPMAIRIERLLSFGYAVPGAVLAIGILLPLGWLDARIIDVSKALLGSSPGLILTGSIIALVYAYTIRFYGVASSTIGAGYARIAPALDDSARVLGVTGFAAFRRVHWPLLRRSCSAAMLLVFIDTLKELPATLTLRPFNFDTLATQVSNLVRDERLGEAAFPSLIIVAASLPAIYLLARTTRTRTERT